MSWSTWSRRTGCDRGSRHCGSVERFGCLLTGSGGILGAMRLSRIAWLITTVVCLVAAVVVLVDGYRGYAAVAFAVAISAGINLL